jgi:uracil-DNA glycosylase
LVQPLFYILLGRKSRETSMDINSVRDLDMAGVKWELADPLRELAVGKELLAKSAYDCCALPISNSATAGRSLLTANLPTMSAAEVAVIGTGDMNALCAAISEFKHPLKMFAKNTVLPLNPQSATSLGVAERRRISNQQLLVITDTPSMDDDNSGKILSGADGQLLDKMLNAIGIKRDDVAICPLVFWRTPGGRTPTEEELNLSKPFVDKFVELSQPKIVLTLGALAEKYQSPVPNPQSRFQIPHPREILMNSDLRKPAWDTLQKVLKVLEKHL